MEGEQGGREGQKERQIDRENYTSEIRVGKLDQGCLVRKWINTFIFKVLVFWIILKGKWFKSFQFFVLVFQIGIRRLRSMLGCFLLVIFMCFQEDFGNIRFFEYFDFIVIYEKSSSCGDLFRVGKEKGRVRLVQIIERCVYR